MSVRKSTYICVYEIITEYIYIYMCAFRPLKGSHFENTAPRNIRIKFRTIKDLKINKGFFQDFSMI